MKTVLILTAGVLLVVGVTKAQFVGRYAEVDSVTNATNAIAPVAIPSSLDQSQEASPEVKLILIALRPEGFETNEMQLEPGDYLFIIGNRTGLQNVNVRLDRDGNERIDAASVGGRQRDWKKRLKLSPGVYVLTANDNPDWICRIVVGR